MVNTTFDARAMVGRWTVHAASGEPAIALLQFARELSVWCAAGSDEAAHEPAGNLEAEYLVDSSGQLVLDPLPWAPGTPSARTWPEDGTAPHVPALPAWLRDAVRIKEAGPEMGGSPDRTTDTAGPTRAPWSADGSDLVLLDAGGQELATLRPGGTPPPGLTPTLSAPPVLTPLLEEMLAPRYVALPDGLAPASVALLTSGRWFPQEPAPENPEGAWVDFTATHRWTGSDGCNRTSGLWLATSSGALRTTSGPTTLMACPGVPVNYWISMGAAIGVTEAGTVVVIGTNGTELGRLTRPTRTRLISS